jgi:hypothetical protein
MFPNTSTKTCNSNCATSTRIEHINFLKIGSISQFCDVAKVCNFKKSIMHRDKPLKQIVNLTNVVSPKKKVPKCNTY